MNVVGKQLYTKVITNDTKRKKDAVSIELLVNTFLRTCEDEVVSIQYRSTYDRNRLRFVDSAMIVLKRTSI